MAEIAVENRSEPLEDGIKFPVSSFEFLFRIAGRGSRFGIGAIRKLPC